VFVFRGKRGDLIKLLWFDGDGLCNPSAENPQYYL
jgi:transposase